MTVTPVIKIDPSHPDLVLIERAAEILREGRVMAFPTETFYGLGADAKNETAVKKIFRIKGREFNNPIPIIIGTREELGGLVEEIPEAAQRLISVFWPGPLTLVFRASKAVSPRLTANTGLIGIRISSHPIARMLAQALGAPLTATSAHLSGETECTTARQVVHSIGPFIDGIIDGDKTPGHKGSTVINIAVSPPQILRIGVISENEIKEALELDHSP